MILSALRFLAVQSKLPASARLPRTTLLYFIGHFKYNLIVKCLT